MHYSVTASRLHGMQELSQVMVALLQVSGFVSSICIYNKADWYNTVSKLFVCCWLVWSLYKNIWKGATDSIQNNLLGNIIAHCWLLTRVNRTWPFQFLQISWNNSVSRVSCSISPEYCTTHPSLLQLIEVAGGQPVWPGPFRILRYLVLEILCRDDSIELELLSIYPKYIKRLCLSDC